MGKPNILEIINFTGNTANLSSKFIIDENIPEIVSIMNQNPNITELILSHNTITDEGANKLESLKFIIRLDLTQTHINGEGIIKLLESTNIQKLIIDDCSLRENIRAYIETAQANGKSVSYAKCTFYEPNSFGY